MKDLKKIFMMGFSHLLVGFTSIVVITRILNFNLPIAFLFAGIGTLIFHLVTQNKLPVVLGVSGLYVGSILYVSNTYGVDYAMGGIVGAGLIYIILGLIMLKYQSKIISYFPEWLLSTVVMLIGLNLLPIGVSMMSSNYFIGVTSFVVLVIVDLFANEKLSLFAMPIGVLAGTVLGFLMGEIDYSVLNTSMNIEFILPKFSWESILAISPIAFAVFFEMLGDSKNVSDVSGVDIFNDVGLGKVAIGNGLATTIGGLFGANAYTTYSENTAFVMLSKYKNPKAQLVTAVLMIIIAFVTPISKIIMLIPQQALGGVVTYLFAMIIINSLKQIYNSKVNLNKDRTAFITMTTMLAVASLPITIGGVSVSSVAVATLVGILMNFIIKKFEEGRYVL